jgi:hypothetical protein
MYYEEKHVQQIIESTQRLIKRIEEGDVQAAERERDELFRLYRMELQWIANQCSEGKIRKRK